MIIVSNISGSKHCWFKQPFHNLLIQKFMETKFNADEKLKLVQHHVEKGLYGDILNFNMIISLFTLILLIVVHAFSLICNRKLLKDVLGKYATRDEVLLADVFLAPQIQFSITWLGIDMTQYPRLAITHAAYNGLPAFQAALPERQPD
ncbi:glutathione S-transferase zeta class-like [Dioscorea cayenensis subsp. rotundata]|uniref:Glutathione S-transferase zeta class-like n=1 Tax=Dioscorea cayennensis subsp. rotundata TaxID=55577 RepID=A0AB40AI05_DIOCR|nr:glutathione S-transferase zeta class-like [Dioscorea cayenensis subsp. rotundata]